MANPRSCEVLLLSAFVLPGTAAKSLLGSAGSEDGIQWWHGEIATVQYCKPCEVFNVVLGQSMTCNRQASVTFYPCKLRPWRTWHYARGSDVGVSTGQLCRHCDHVVCHRSARPAATCSQFLFVHERANGSGFSAGFVGGRAPSAPFA